MITDQDLIYALRCSASVDCKCIRERCPFWVQEDIPEELREKCGGKDKWDSCDIDGVALAAADRLAGRSPAEQTPPDRFLAQTKWGKVILVERRSWGDRDWLAGGLYIPKDIVWWWPLPEAVGGTK